MVGVHFQKVKLDVGGDGVSAPVSNANPIPVSDAGGALTVDGTVAVSSVGGTVDTELPAAAALADDVANPTVPAVGSYLVGYNRANADWDRVTVSRTNADGLASHAAGNLVVQARLLAFNGTTWDRIRGDVANGLQVDLGVNNDVTVTGSVTANAGTNLNTSALALEAGGNLAAAAASLAVLDNVVAGSEAQVDVVAALPTGTNTIGAVTPKPIATGGLSIFRSLDLDETEEQVSASACAVYGWFITNAATATRYVKFYNDTAANVIVGTTTPVITLPIPGNSSDDISANALGAMGIAFGTALTLAATTGLADADTGAPGANEVIINLFYI